MKGLLRELLTIWGGLIVLFLVLTHFTGFERDVRALSAGGVVFTRQLQGIGRKGDVVLGQAQTDVTGQGPDLFKGWVR